jgi:4-methyl-5(b-hydroxyethyl)-thiazole monophosphate biosynthesis
MPSVLVVLAEGAEEIETVTVADVLVRAGQQVTVASAGKGTVVTGSRGIPLAAHTMLDQVREQAFDLVYLPGGMGSAKACREDARIQDLAGAQLQSGRRLAIICASVTALAPRKLGQGRRVTSYPGVRAEVEPHVGAWLDQPVVVDRNLVTSQGPGTALALGLTLARQLAGDDTARSVAQAMLTSLPN